MSDIDNTDDMSLIKDTIMAKGFFLIEFDARRSTFTKKIKLPEIGVEELDRKVITNGAKLVIGDEIPGLFRKPIAQAEEHLRIYCPRLGSNTYMCPEHLREETINILSQCKREFYRHKIWLKMNYKNLLLKWARKCNANPKLPNNFGDLILQQHFEWDYLDTQLKFHFEELNSNTFKKGVSSSFMSELTFDAESYLTRMLTTAKENNEVPRMNKSRINALEKFKTRLKTVKLLEPELGYAINLIDNWISSHPLPMCNAEEEGKAIRDLIALLRLLSDEKTLRANYHIAKNLGDYSSITIGDLKDSILNNIEI